MNDITLVNLSIAKNFNGKTVYMHNSAGIFLLVAALEKAGFKAGLKEYSMEYGRSLPAELENFLSAVDTAPRLIGIGCHSVHMPFAVKAAQALKLKFPEKTVVLGGPGPSGAAKELLEKFPFIDAVSVGESEETIVEIVREGAPGFAGIKGLAYRGGAGVTLNPPRPHIADLSSLPMPAYHTPGFRGNYQIATVLTSRGCPYRCGFCSLTDFDGRRLRYNSIPNVLAELTLLKNEYGFSDLFFVDPNFSVNRERTLELCRAIKKANLGLKWFAMTRTECVDPALLDEMAAAGCKTVFYGLDSGSETVLAAIKRGSGLKKALAAIEMSTAHIPNVEVGLMWGFPFETLEDFKRTLEVRERLEAKGCTAQLRWLEPYPATEIFQAHKSELFLPVEHSLMFQPAKLAELVREGKLFYREEGDTCRLPADVTSVRTIIAASQVAGTCRDIIEANPYIFTDFYRYRTPDLDEKLRLASRYSAY
ncbi:MAG: B12-binding domain-containing radical SAM protein [Elusimicrobiales bacterium]|nr:B12-binding domain-containing radical SAM protein [Elusimicrobiales bacterium]